jgi:hypothetical protein
MALFRGMQKKNQGRHASTDDGMMRRPSRRSQNTARLLQAKGELELHSGLKYCVKITFRISFCKEHLMRMNRRSSPLQLPLALLLH